MTKTVSRLSAVTLAGVLAVATFSLYTYEAAAFRGGDDDRTVVRTDSSATVSNNVSVTANTGGNDALGGGTRSGGDGGDAYRGTGGRGGNGGNGGDGGTVTSGNATSIGTVSNDVNHNNVHVEGCGCDDDEEVSPNRFSRFFHFGNNDDTLTRVDTTNQATVRTTLDVDSNTGRNDVDGGDGSAGGEGGDAQNQSRRSWLNWFWLNQGGNGGNGGNGGDGGTGGTVRTGTAGADGLVTNVVNRNVIRVNTGE